MKKYLIYLACLLPILLSSCDETILQFPEGEGEDPTLVNINLALNVDPSIELYDFSATKAPGRDYKIRWIVEVYRDEIKGEPAERRILFTDLDPDNNHTAYTSFALHAAKYKIVAWAEYVDLTTGEDTFYRLNGLSSIQILEKESYIGDDDHKDTYIAHREVDFSCLRDQWNSTWNYTITLKRPMAKIEFITTDVDKFLEKINRTYREQGTDKFSLSGSLLGPNPDITSVRVKVEYAGYFPSSFNAYTNKPNDAILGMGFDCNVTPMTEKEAHLASDYVFVNGTESAIICNVRLYDNLGNYLNGIEGIRVPVVRGKLTVIRDEFLTRSVSSGIGINTEFEGEINIVMPG